MIRAFSILLLLTFLVSGCGNDDPVTALNETVIYQRDGIIESFGGDCSAVQIRTSSLSNHDFNSFNNLRFEFTAFSDADLSSISVYYVKEGNTEYLMNLTDRDMINSTMSFISESPDYSGELFLRLTLKSSVCTGQIFHIEMRDLKIFAVN